MSRRKSCNATVDARECRGNHEKMIRKFLKKVKNCGILEEVRDRRYYMKPSEKRRRDRARCRGGEGENRQSLKLLCENLVWQLLGSCVHRERGSFFHEGNKQQLVKIHDV